MKLAALLVVGNSSDVFDGCIAHHRGLGVDEFVIVHIHSDDDTPDKLLELSRRDNSIHAVFASNEDAISGRIYKLALHKIRDELRPDWIIRLDCDERWFVRVGNLKDVLAASASDVLTAPRYNAVWPSPSASQYAGQIVLSDKDLPIAAYPVEVPPSERALQSISWVLTRIGPKSCIRADAPVEFDTGGHRGLDKLTGMAVAGERPSNVLVAQLAFTVRERFERKLKVLSSAWAMLRTGRSKDEGWHWDRLALIHDRGPEAVQGEWEKQFMSPDSAREVVGAEVIVNAIDAYGI